MVLVGGAVAWKVWPRTVPADQCSVTYRHYADVAGIDASFIKDKRIGGGDCVDVTLLEATDSAAWVSLLRDFDMQAFDVEPDEDFFIHYLSAKNHPEQRVPFAPGLCDLVVLWPANLSACIFHIETEAQYDRLLKHEFENIEQ